MLKKVSLFASLLFLCALSTSAFAAKQTFEHFSIDVPAGWTATQQEATVAIAANDKSASVSITVASLQGMAIGDFAAAISSSYKGSEPEAEDDVYQFTFQLGEVESTAILTEYEEGTYALIVITGEHPQVEEIINSME